MSSNPFKQIEEIIKRLDKEDKESEETQVYIDPAIESIIAKFCKKNKKENI